MDFSSSWGCIALALRGAFGGPVKDIVSWLVVDLIPLYFVLLFSFLGCAGGCGCWRGMLGDGLAEGGRGEGLGVVGTERVVGTKHAMEQRPTIMG